jgi:hypothetical protein
MKRAVVISVLEGVVGAMRPRSCAGAVLMAGTILGSVPAHAQGYYINPGMFTNMYAVNGAQLAQNLQFAARMKELRAVQDKLAAGSGARSGTGPAAAAASGATAAPAAPFTATDFKPTGPRDAPQRLAAQLNDPATRQQVTKMAREILAAIEQQPAFRKNNLAYALMVFLGGSLQVLSGQEFSDAQTERLAQWINDQMVATGAVAQLSDAQRTQLYDVLLLQGGLILGIAQAGAETNNAEQVQQAKTMARDALATFGVRL